MGAACAGQEAEFDLRQAVATARITDPVVGGHRSFEATAESGAVDRGDDGLGGILHRRLGLLEGPTLASTAEFGDVRAGDEGAPGTEQHDGLDRVVGDCLLDAVGDAGADMVAERVDGGIVDRQYGDAITDVEGNGLGHRSHWGLFTGVGAGVGTAGRSDPHNLRAASYEMQIPRVGSGACARTGRAGRWRERQPFGLAGPRANGGKRRARCRRSLGSGAHIRETRSGP